MIPSTPRKPAGVACLFLGCFPFCFSSKAMNPYWSPVVETLTPYVPGEQPKGVTFIKLNTNEHPYGPSPEAILAIQAAAQTGLERYPDPHATALKSLLAERLELGPEQLFVGNGSDEVLAHAFMALFRHENPIWFPDVTYSFYPSYCRLYGIAFRTVPVDEAFRISPADFLPQNGQKAGGIIFPNPNAPTGRLLPLAAIDRIAEGNPQCVVLVDEAYIDFGGVSAASLIARHANLLVVQTFSKSRGLAGLRVGFAAGHPALIEALERVKDSFNSYPLDRLALAGAEASLRDERHFEESCARIIENREALSHALGGLGFNVLPSMANFVLASHPTHEAAGLAQGLREKGILVRHFHLPRIENFLRITIGTESDCKALIAGLTHLL